MDVDHDTPFSASLAPIVDRDGSEARLALLKATFEFLPDGAVRVADPQEPIRHADVHRAKPVDSSIVSESDGAYFKPLTDIVVIGAAFSPGKKPVRSLAAGVRVGRVIRRVAVFGDRIWQRRLTGWRISEAEPFTEWPVCWERCFGGLDPSPANPAKQEWEPRNPIGTGFRASTSESSLEGVRLPNFENPQALIGDWRDRPAPHGLGYTGRSWAPRIGFAGTYDDRWRRTRMPILPEDFDYRFFNAAPEGMMCADRFVGGEPVEIVNLTASGQDGFTLPRMQVTFAGWAKHRRFHEAAVLDTVEIRGVTRTLVLVWRLKYAVLVNDTADSVSATVRMLH